MYNINDFMDQINWLVWLKMLVQVFIICYASLWFWRRIAGTHAERLVKGILVLIVIAVASWALQLTLITSMLVTTGPRPGLLCSRGFVLVQLVSLDKAVNATFSVNNLLLASVERMAIAANFYPDCIFCGTQLYFIATHASGNDVKVLGMNPFFHNDTLKYRQ